MKRAFFVTVVAVAAFAAMGCGSSSGSDALDKAAPTANVEVSTPSAPSHSMKRPTQLGAPGASAAPAAGK